MSVLLQLKNFRLPSLLLPLPCFSSVNHRPCRLLAAAGLQPRAAAQCNSSLLLPNFLPNYVLESAFQTGPLCAPSVASAIPIPTQPNANDAKSFPTSPTALVI
ncbi:hypothetical protein Tsp_02864 [Trichinella spiralis]|uniref:hypothetical protein n=1 Tax=Trichinella spiralis TaxID=6334 RepID=UPI0001EFC98D|nr:hypothetical protein Tsp_02864 [Trichinella spiralis]